MWIFRSDLVPRRLLRGKRSQKRDLWFGMPLKRKVFIKHMNVLEWFGYRCDCADEYNPTYYCFESYGSKNDCPRSILTLKRLLVWLYLEEGNVWLWMWLLRSDFASLMTANRTLAPKITALKDLALKSTAFKAIAQYMTSRLIPRCPSPCQMSCPRVWIVVGYWVTTLRLPHTQLFHHYDEGLMCPVLIVNMRYYMLWGERLTLPASTSAFLPTVW